MPRRFICTCRHTSHSISTPRKQRKSCFFRLLLISETNWMESCLSRSVFRRVIPSVIAPRIQFHSSGRVVSPLHSQSGYNPLEFLGMFGLPISLYEHTLALSKMATLLPGAPAYGLIGKAPAYHLPWSPMQIPEAKHLINDSAKLARLDSLLNELKAGDHRVLIYCQMTRMMDLMEEYLVYRQYKYLRLDGSSKLEDRRDMVIDWQTRSVQ